MTNHTGSSPGQSSSSGYRVIIIGSRTWTDETPIWAALDQLLDQHDQLIIHHGGAPGVDRSASGWVTHNRALSNRPIIERVYLPNWALHGSRAGILRNLTMVEAGADLCLAFIRANSPGATHCAKAAQAAGIPTRITRWSSPP